MPNYKKMYTTLCIAIDEVLDEMNKISPAIPCAKVLEKALLEAEEIYIQTASELPEKDSLSKDP